MRQRKFDEAKKYLETAIAGGQKNHIAHYNYAYVLSRESMDEFGYVTSFPADKAKKMRDSLFRAIELNPNFSESYSLLAFIGMVNNENLDEAVAYLKKGLAVEPGNQEYVLQMAEIYLRQQKFREAKEIAENLVRTAAEPEIHTRAEGVLRSLSQYEEAMAHNEALRKQYESGAGRPGRPALKERKTLSDAEIKKLQEDSVIDSLNRLLQKPKEGEKQAVGYVQKITCAGGAVTYSVKTESESLTLTSKDFASLDLLAVTPEAETLALGCSAKIQDILTVIVYRPGKDAKAKNTLLALAFVPKNFKLRTAEEMAKNDALINESMGNDEDAQSYTETVISGPAESTGPSGEAFPTDEDRRAAILKRIGDSLRKPQADEKRVMGILEKIECVKDKMIFYVKAETQTLRLRAASLQDIKLNLFTNEISGVQIGCGKKPEPVLSVITFRPDNNPKAKENGEIVAVEYVPRTFKLP
jgi:tetratricopeptide (TPR) repeat protein